MLRRATIEDSGKIGAVHVASWQETYADLLPKDMLVGLSIDARSAIWAEILGDPSAFAETAAYVAEDNGSIVGFGACGSQRDPHLKGMGFDAEISAIYVLQSGQRRGFGRALMREMAKEIRMRKHEAATLWVLRENTAAREFYGHLGGEIVAEKEDKRGKTTLVEIAYGWRRLAPLLGHL